MAVLRLKEGRSYMYKGYVFEGDKTVSVDGADLKYLLDTGRFEQVGAKEAPKEEPKDEALADFEEEEAPKVKKPARKSK